MKRNPDFMISDVAGSHILVPIGKASLSFNSLITLNDMGEQIWGMLEKEISEAELLRRILEDYEVTEEKAAADIGQFLKELREYGCLEETL